MRVKILVEGKEDKEFLEAYLSFLGYSSVEFLESKGNRLNKDILSSMQESQDKNQNLLLIFDADKNQAKTLERLLAESEGILKKEEIFLFPNHCDEGELESLLFSIAKEPKVHQCFENYKKCICSYNPNYLNNIHKKSARYAYFEALGLLGWGKKEIAKRKEAYPQIFDFSSSKLNPLKDFLAKHFQMTELKERLEEVKQGKVEMIHKSIQELESLEDS